MPEKFTTIRVYEKDKDTLIERFGGPAHEAVHKAIDENCPHPEAKRRYMTANLPIANASQRRAVGGFHCEACGQYVFRNRPETVAG